MVEAPSMLIIFKLLNKPELSATSRKFLTEDFFFRGFRENPHQSFNSMRSYLEKPFAVVLQKAEWSLEAKWIRTPRIIEIKN